VAKKTTKFEIVAFKVEAQLAELLNKLPNKSAFIRKAIESMLGVFCPLCHGKGVVPRGICNHFSPIIAISKTTGCESCFASLEVPIETTELDLLSRQRMEQFFLDGSLFCDDCYQKKPSCESCGWRVKPEDVEEHQRLLHSES